MEEVIIGSDPNDYKLVETFTTTSANIDADSLYYVASGNTWVGYQAAGGAGKDYTSTAPTGGARGYATSGAASGTNDNMIVDVGVAYTQAYIVAKLDSTETLDIFMRPSVSGVIRTDSTFTGIRMRARNNGGAFQTNPNWHVAGTGTALQDTAGASGNTNHSSVAPAVTFSIKITLLTDRLHVDVGGVRRTFLEDTSNNLLTNDGLGTNFGFTMSPGGTTSQLNEIRLW